MMKTKKKLHFQWMIDEADGGVSKVQRIFLFTIRAMCTLTRLSTGFSSSSMSALQVNSKNSL